LAEHLGLRSRDELLGWISEAGLQVLGRSDIKPNLTGFVNEPRIWGVEAGFKF
jgi:hypothetical protein